MQDSKLLHNQIYNLESRLLDPDVRKSAQRISELIAEDFWEHCCSGGIYHYTPNAVFLLEGQPDDLNWEIVDYQVTPLAGDVALTTYKLIKHSETPKEYSLRSSIWKRFAGRWKLVFHQGTLTAKFE